VVGDDASGGMASSIPLQPHHRGADIEIGQVHHQVNGTASAGIPVPVRELLSRDRNGTLFRVPFLSITSISGRIA
jgi:hypothetical protein